MNDFAFSLLVADVKEIKADLKVVKDLLLKFEALKAETTAREAKVKSPKKEIANG